MGFVLIGLAIVCRHQSYYISCLHLGMRVRVAAGSLIYRKTLLIKGAGLDNRNTGLSVNMLANDVTRLDLCCHYIHMIWVAPLQLVIVVVITWYSIGPSTFAGAFILLLILTFQSKDTFLYCVGQKNKNIRQLTTGNKYIRLH